MTLRKALAFLRPDLGAASVEAVIVAPMLFVAGCELTDLFLGFRMNGLSYRGAYAVADAVSRIGDEARLDQEQIDDLHDLYRFLIKSDGTTSIRVTVVAQDTHPVSGEPVTWIKFSEVAGTEFTGYRVGTADIPKIRDQIPLLGRADEVIITETFAQWEPAYIDIGTRDFHEVVVARPRFTQSVDWDDGSGTVLGEGGGPHDDDPGGTIPDA